MLKCSSGVAGALVHQSTGARLCLDGRELLMVAITRVEERQTSTFLFFMLFSFLSSFPPNMTRNKRMVCV